MNPALGWQRRASGYSLSNLDMCRKLLIAKGHPACYDFIVRSKESAKRVRSFKPRRRRLTAAQIRRLPREKRDAILEASAARALMDYVSDVELTGFDAFAEEEKLHGHASDVRDQSR